MCKFTVRCRTVLVADLELEDLRASLSLFLNVPLILRDNDNHWVTPKSSSLQLAATAGPSWHAALCHPPSE